MNAHSGRLGLVIGWLLLASPAAAALIDHGPSGEYFYDTSTGLYWYDPAQLVGQTRAEMDAFASASPQWAWATSAQIDALAGQSSGGGVPLESVVGPRQHTLNNGAPRWLGYYADPGQPDGWIVQAFTSLDSVSSTGPQTDAATFPDITGVGGWMVSSVDPVPEPQILWLASSGALLVVAGLRRPRQSGAREERRASRARRAVAQGSSASRMFE